LYKSAPNVYSLLILKSASCFSTSSLFLVAVSCPCLGSPHCYRRNKGNLVEMHIPESVVLGTQVLINNTGTADLKFSIPLHEHVTEANTSRQNGLYIT